MKQQDFLSTGWLTVKDGDPTFMTLFRGHYSYEPPKDGRRKKMLGVGPGEKLVLVGADGAACCAWRKEGFRLDGQDGVNCSVFRRESGEVASEMLKSAMALAWDRWPGERLFTFIDPARVRPTMVKGPRGFEYPVFGYCFYQAGWRFCGLTQKRLHILEITP